MYRFLSTLGVTIVVALPVAAEEFRWASTTDPQTMDPHAVSSAPVLGVTARRYVLHLPWVNPPC